MGSNGFLFILKDKFQKLFIIFAVLCFSFFISSTAFATPKNISFQSKIYKPDGTPLESPSVQFKFSLMNPLSTCVIYSETFSPIDLTGSSGNVVLALGAGTRSYPAAGGMNWYDAFNNSTSTYTCQSTGNYSPTLIDSRRLVMQFNDGSGAGWQTMPAMEINSVPFAMFSEDSEKLAGRPVTDFVLGSALPTCGATDYMQFDGTNFTCTTPAASAVAPSGITAGGASAGQVLKWNGSNWVPSADNTSASAVTSVTSTNAYLSVANGTTTPSLTLNVGSAANTVAAGNDSRITGAFQTTTTLSGDLTGTLPNPVVANGAINNAKISDVAFGKITGKPTTLAGYGITDAFSSSLNSGLIFVGNGSNLAEGRALSGDATIDNAGVLTLTNSNATRTHLGLGGAAVLNVGTGVGTVAAGDDARFTDARIPTGAASGDLTGTFPNPTIAAGAVNNSKISDVAFSKITGTPTTLAGYGITDGASSSLTASQIFVGNASNIAQSRVLSGDATMDVNGILTINNNAITNAKVLSVNWSKITSTPTTVAGYGITDALTTSSVLSGDVSGPFNSVVLTPTGVTAGTYSKVTVDAKGRVTSATNIGSSDVTTALGYTPSSNALSSANVFIGNASNVAQGRVLSGDATLSNTGILIINNGVINNAKISDVAFSKITGTPTTLAGYGITDASTSTLASANIFVGNASNLAEGRVLSGDATINNSGILALTNVGAGGTFPKVTYDTKGRVLSGSALSSSDVTTGLGYTPSSNGLNSGLFFVGNASNVAAGVALSGDIASVTNAGIVTFANTGVGTGTYSKVTVDTKGRVTSATNIGSGDVTTALGYTPSSNALSSANIFVGNASNVAQGQVLSGDATINNSGILALTNVGAGGTFPKVTFDTKGRVLSGSSLSSSDVTTGLGYTPSSNTLSSANIFVGNASNVAQGQVLSGDATINNSGILTFNSVNGSGAGIYSKVTVDTKGRVTAATNIGSTDVTTALGYTPSSNTLNSGLFFVGNASNVAAGVALSGDIASVTNAGIVTFANVGAGGTFPKVTYDTKGRVLSGSALSSTDVTTGLGYTPSSNALTSANIFVGNASNVAQGQVLSGDATINNSGILTFVNTGVGTGTYSKVTVDTKGRVTSATNIGSTDVTTALGYTPSSNALNSGLVFVGNSSNVAAGVAFSGDIASVSNAGIVTFANVGTGGTFPKVTYDTKGRVLSGSALSSSDVTTGLGYTPSSNALTSANIFVGNASNVAQGQVLSGDATINNSGILTFVNTGVGTGTYSKVTVDTKGRVTAATNIGSTDVTTALGYTPSSNTLNSGLFFVGNASNVAAGVALSGDIAAVTSAGIVTFANVGAGGTFPKVTFDTKGRVLSGSALSSTDVTTGLGYTPSSNALTSANIFVGNASNVAQGQVLSGDATINNSGILTFNSVNGSGAGTYSKVTVDTKGRVTSATNIGSTDVTTALGYTPSSNALTSANIFVGNASNVAQGQVLSGDATINNSGILTFVNTGVGTGTYSKVTVDTKGRVTSATNIGSTDVTTALGYTPSSNTLNSGLFFVGNASNVAAGVALSGDISSVTSAGIVTFANVGAGGTFPKVTYDTKGRVLSGSALSSTDVTTGLGYTPSSNALSSANIFVGNASNVAQGQVLSGDATINNSGILTFVNTGVGTGTYSKVTVDTKGRVTSATNIGSTDVTTALGYTPSSNALSSANIFVGNASNVAQGQVLSGDATINSSGILTLSSIVTPGTYPRVTFDAKGRITAGSAMPSSDVTTALGYTPSSNALNSGLFFVGNASNVAAGVALSGDIASVTNSGIVTLANVGAGGTFPKVTYDTKGRVLSGSALSSTDVTTGLGYTPSSNALTSANIFVGNASNVAQGQVLSGDATINNSGILTFVNTGVGTGTYSKVTVDTKGRVTSATNIGSTDVTTALGYTPSSNTLNSGLFFVGNASNVAAGVALSGDIASVTNAGIVTFANVGAGGTFPKVTYDTKGRVLSGSALSSSDVTTGLGYTPSSNALTSANIFVGNASNVAQGQVLSGDATINNSGILTLSSIVTPGTYPRVTFDAKGRITAGSAMPSSDVTTALGYTPSSNALNSGLFFVGNASNVAAGVALSGDVASVTNAGIVTFANVGAGGTFPKVTYDTKGRVLSGSALSSSDVTTGLGYTPSSNALTSANIFVGNASNVAQGQVLSGDATINNSGILTFNSVNGSGAGTYSKVTVDTKGRVTSATNIGSTDVTTALGYTPSSNSLSSANIFVGNASNVAQGQVLSGDATINNSGILTLSSIVTPGTYPRVTFDAKGRITAGSAMPSSDVTTALGYTPSSNALNSGLFFVGNASNVAAGVALSGDIASVTSAGIVTFANVGAGGTFPKVTYDTKGRVLSGSALSSSDVTTGLGYTPSSNALTSANIFVGNASNVAQGQVLSGDATINNSGILTFVNTGVGTGTYSKVTVDTKGRVTSATNIGSTDVTTALGYTPSSNTLSSANIFVGNASNVAQGQVLSGDATINNSGILALVTTGVGTGTYSKVTVDTKGRVTAATNIGSADVTTALGYTPSSNTLNSGLFFVGNASNVAAGVALSGDIASVTNAGIVTFANVGAGGTFPKVTYDTKGRVLSGSALSSSDVTTGLGYTPSSNALTSANIFVGNASNVAQGQVLSGDATINNSGILTLSSIVTPGTYPRVTFDAKGRITAGSAMPSSDVTTALGYTPSSNALNSGLFFVGNASNVAAGVALSGDIASVTNAGIVTFANTGVGTGTYSKVTVDTKGRVTSATNIGSTDVTTALGYTPSSNALSSANIFVGNASNVAQGQVLSGDATINSSGILTLSSIVTPGTYPRVTFDAKGRITAGSAMPSSDVTTALGYTPSSNALSSANIFVGNASNVAQGQVLSGDATINNSGILTFVNTGVGTGTYSKVTVDTKGRVTSATNIGSTDVTTALGYTPSSNALNSGLFFVGNASNVAAGVALSGDIASVTNAGIVTFANVGAGGTFPKVTYDTKGRVLSGSALSSSDVTTGLGYTPSSNALSSANIFVGNASNVAQGQVLSGDATINNSGILSLVNSGVTASTYKSVTVDAKGRVTAGTNPTTLAGFGITDGASNSLSSANIFVGNASNVAQGQVLSGDATITNAGILTINNNAITNAKISSVAWSKITATPTTLAGYSIAMTSGDVTTALGFTPSTTSLSSAKIYIGNASNIEQAQTLSGDATLSNTGILSLSTTGVSAGTYSKVTVDTKGRVTASSALISSDITTALGFTPSSGAGTVTGVTAAATVGNPITVSASSTSPSIDITRATASVNGYLASSDFTTFNNKLTSTLSSANIFIGNASNIAQGQVLSGDATITNAGILTLASVATPGTFARVTVDAKGRVTSGSALLSSDVTTALGYTAVNKAGDTMSGTLNLPSNGFTVGTSQLVVSGGNVGIGTSTPTSSLIVTGTNSAPTGAGTNPAGISMGVTSGLYPRISLDNGVGAANVAGNQWNIDNYTGSLRFFTGGSVKMQVDSTGNVGIGTTTPAQKLSVVGTIESTSGGFKFPDGTTQTTAGASVASVAGTTNYITKFTSGSTVGNSTLTDDGTTITAGGQFDVTGGTGTAYNTAPIEVRTTLTPRIAFHNPGVVASQLGMDASGVIRTYDNPGTGYENFAAKNITGNGTVTSTGAMSAGTTLASGTTTSVGTSLTVGTDVNFTTASPTLTASSFLQVPNGMYISTGNLYTAAAIQARGGVHNDTAAYLTISGGTSGDTYVSGNNLGVGTASPAGKLTVSGAGQATASFNTSTAQGASLILDDTTAAGGNGGALVFSAASQAWKFAAIKGMATDGASNSRGDVVISTRRIASDATLTEAVRVVSDGTVTVNGGKITGVGTPTNPTDVATKAYVDAQAGGLKIYQNDGTTVVGNYVGCMVPPCGISGSGWGYSDVTTGAVSILGATTYASTGTLYYAGAGCTGGAFGTSGNAYIYDGVNTASFGGQSFNNWTVASYRVYGGSCTATAGTAWSVDGIITSMPTCGLGACKIK